MNASCAIARGTKRLKLINIAVKTLKILRYKFVRGFCPQNDTVSEKLKKPNRSR